MTAPDAAVQALVRAAVEGTRATSGWLLERDGDELVVRAADAERPGELIGRRIPASGTAGFTVSSGQPLALSNVGADARFSSDPDVALLGPPNSVLCVPCADDEHTFGALEVVDKMGRARFSIDDLELLTLFADIAGAMLAQADDRRRLVPQPNELASELRRVAVSNPVRYAALAASISALLANE